MSDTGRMVDDTARDRAIYHALKAADEVAAALQTHLIEEHGADPDRAAPQSPWSRRKTTISARELAMPQAMEATVKLVRQLGGRIAGLGFAIELDFLKGRDRFEDLDVFSLLHYDE